MRSFRCGRQDVQPNTILPGTVPEIPTTGMAAYPRYRYHTGKEAQERYGDNPWAVSVATPVAFMNWDMMLYLPRQNYPATGYGGRLERMDDWVYVHE